MGKSQSSVREFALIGFLLLAVLFGMQIMTFIFGQLGPSNSGLTANTVAYNQSQAIQNYSLVAIGNYAAHSGTQFTTLGIAVTLIILVAVFLFFWVAFIGKKGSGSSSGNFA